MLAVLIAAGNFCFGQATGIKPIDDGLLLMKNENYGKAASVFLQALNTYPNNYILNANLGTALMKLNKSDSALLFFNKAIAIEPSTAETYVNRGLIYLQLRDTVKGLADQQKAIALQPALAVAYENIGYTLLQQKKYAASIGYFEQAIAKNIYSYKAYCNEAGALSALNRHDEAVALLSKIITLKPDYSNAYYNRAKECGTFTGDLDLALADCNKMLALDAKDTAALLLRAGIKDKIGDHAGAIADCDRAIRIDPRNAAAYNERAICRFDIGDQAGIIKDCDSAIMLKPDFYEAYVQRGDAYDELGQFAKAISDYEKAIALQPGNFIGYRERAASALHQQDYKTALVFIDKGLAIQPGNLFLLKNKVALLVLQRDFNGAISTLDKCISFDKDSAALYHFNKASLYDSLHNAAGACKSAFEALTLGLADGYDFIMKHGCEAYKQQPRVKAAPLIDKAQELERQGKGEEVIETLSQAIAILPDMPTLYYNRGLAKRRLKRFDQAITDYTKAISLNPAFIEAILSRSVAKGYLGDLDGAKKDCLLAIKTDSTNAMAYNNYATMIEETDIEQAVSYYSKAIRYNKNYTMAYLNRARMYLKLGQKDKACADLQRADKLGSLDAKAEFIYSCR